MITLGCEEEFFITEPDLPGMNSLWYLSRIMYSDIRRYYKGTAYNFARGSDAKVGKMSGIEVSTGICTSVDELMVQILENRKTVSEYCKGYVVPLGHLLQTDTPSNVCALQFHIGIPGDRDQAYNRIARYLPLLIVLCAHSPLRKGIRFGQSYRLAAGYATGTLTGNPLERFQDLIISRRLGTIEVRAFDSNPDINRIRMAANAIFAIVNQKFNCELDTASYKKLRDTALSEGMAEELFPLYKELSGICDLPLALLEETQADLTSRLYDSVGVTGTYQSLDRQFRGCEYNFRKKAYFLSKIIQPASGFLCYYMTRLPYVAYKWIKEKD